MYIYIYISQEYASALGCPHVRPTLDSYGRDYGQFSEFHACFCGLDSGNLKFETVRTNKQHICF